MTIHSQLLDYPGAFQSNDIVRLEIALYTQLAWLPDEHPIITLESALEDPGDTRVRFWDIETGMPPVEFRGESADLKLLTFMLQVLIKL